MEPVTNRQIPNSGVKNRIGCRRPVSLPGRLTWRDAAGTLRFVSVVTRNVSDTDLFVECHVPASIPMFRLVHFQLERSARDVMDLPPVLRRDAKVLSAVYRVGPRTATTGTPGGYALRMLVEPNQAATVPVMPQLAVAN